MAYFAKLDSNNIVTKVLSVNNNVIKDSNGVEQENLGIEFLKTLYNEPDAIWKKTSFNSRLGNYYLAGSAAGVENLHPDQSKCFRKNFAGVGFIYDQSRDAFIPPKLYNSWILNEQSCIWEPPVPQPDSVNGVFPIWDENSTQWVYPSI
jgi:hypothetical protein